MSRPVARLQSAAIGSDLARDAFITDLMKGQIPFIVEGRRSKTSFDLVYDIDQFSQPLLRFGVSHADIVLNGSLAKTGRGGKVTRISH